MLRGIEIQKNVKKRISIAVSFTIFSVIFFLGVILGFVSRNIVHELGHFVPAYAFDKNNVVGIQFFYKEFVDFFLEFNLTGSFALAKTYFYNHPVEFYGLTKGAIIVLGGLIFNLIFLLGVIIYFDKLKTINRINEAPIYLFYTGFYLGLISIISSWRGDIKELFDKLELSQFTLVSTEILLFLLIASIYFSNFIKYLKNFGFVPPKFQKEFNEHMKKIDEEEIDIIRKSRDWNSFLIFIFLGIYISLLGYFEMSLDAKEIVQVIGIYVSLGLVLYSLALPTASFQIKSGKTYYNYNEGEPELLPEKLYDTRFIVANASRFPGRFYVDLNLKINGNPVSPGDLYVAKKPWKLFPGKLINGHFRIDNVIRSSNVTFNEDVRVTMEIRVRNAGFSKYIIKYPTQHWNFDFNVNMWHDEYYGLHI